MSQSPSLHLSPPPSLPRMFVLPVYKFCTSSCTRMTHWPLARRGTCHLFTASTVVINILQGSKSLPCCDEVGGGVWRGSALMHVRARAHIWSLSERATSCVCHVAIGPTLFPVYMREKSGRKRHSKLQNIRISNFLQLSQTRQQSGEKGAIHTRGTKRINPLHPYRLTFHHHHRPRSHISYNIPPHRISPRRVHTQ